LVVGNKRSVDFILCIPSNNVPGFAIFFLYGLVHLVLGLHFFLLLCGFQIRTALVISSWPFLRLWISYPNVLLLIPRAIAD
jgi:hypothetical protein